MNAKSATLIALVASITFVSCSRSEQTVRMSNSHLTITGSKEDIERFTALQGSRRPTLAVSAIKLLRDGRDGCRREVGR